MTRAIFTHAGTHPKHISSQRLTTPPHPGSVASYDLRPGNGAGPYSGRQETEEEIEEKARHIKNEEGKIQIGKVSKNK